MQERDPSAKYTLTEQCKPHPQYEAKHHSEQLEESNLLMELFSSDAMLQKMSQCTSKVELVSDICHAPISPKVSPLYQQQTIIVYPKAPYSKLHTFSIATRHFSSENIPFPNSQQTRHSLEFFEPQRNFLQQSLPFSTHFGVTKIETTKNCLDIVKQAEVVLVVPHKRGSQPIRRQASLSSFASK